MPKVLALMAHPDDIEITCAGTLMLLEKRGLGRPSGDDDGGRHGVDAAVAGRRSLASAGARPPRRHGFCGAGYDCLGFSDLTILCDERSKRRVSGLIREVRPDLLITHPPVDYMADHEETARVAREAAFASTMPNWKAAKGGAPPCDALPVILYADPIDHIDLLRPARRRPATSWT